MKVAGRTSFSQDCILAPNTETIEERLNVEGLTYMLTRDQG